MSLTHYAKLFLALVLLTGSLEVVRAQPRTPGATDPIMQLMTSQPAIDVSSPVVATAWFEPNMVEPGEKAVYRITLNALESAVRLPDRIPAPRDLKFRLSAQGQMMQTASNMFRPFTTFNYDVRASKPGLFTVPSFVIPVYGKQVVVPEANFEVVEEVPQPHRAAEQLILECGVTNAFVGETIPVRVLSRGSPANVLQAIIQMQLNGDGFLSDKRGMRQSIQQIVRNGLRLPTYVCETTLTPIIPGQITVSAQGFTAGNQFEGPITIQGSAIIPGGPPQFLLLDSEPVTIRVRPLPAGELPGFTGTIGNYTCDPPRLATNTMRVGDPLQMTVTIRGVGDWSRIVPPPAPRVRNWQVFPAVSGGIVPGFGPTNPGVVFNYTLIPLTDETKATPAIPFSCFNPETSRYVNLTIPAAPVEVVANEMATGTLVLPPSSDEDYVAEKKPALSGLAQSPGRTTHSLVPPQLRDWFPAAQFFPTFVFAGLWIWDRRRRHLEQHPEIVRRRAARRRLRRQKHLLKRAAAKGDAPAFTRYAVAAMKVACAPHFPADPQALVCADVLSLFDPGEQDGRVGEIVRRFFSAEDESSFAATPRDHVEVFTFKSELEDILSKLQERL